MAGEPTAGAAQGAAVDAGFGQLLRSEESSGGPFEGSSSRSELQCPDSNVKAEEPRSLSQEGSFLKLSPSAWQVCVKPGAPWVELGSCTLDDATALEELRGFMEEQGRNLSANRRVDAACNNWK